MSQCDECTVKLRHVASGWIVQKFKVCPDHSHVAFKDNEWM